jgi:hypothetical protein
MPRDNSGVVTLPVGNPVVAGTAISADVANATNADLASMIEDSLSRSGKGGMNSPMQFGSGSDANPSITFTADTNTGFYLPADADIGVAINGSKIMDVIATGVSVAGNIDVSGNLNVVGVVNAVPYAVSAVSTGDTTALYINPAVLTTVTNLTVTLATKGRPVIVSLIADGTTNDSFVSVGLGAADAVSGEICILRDASIIYATRLGVTSTGSTTVSLDVAPGTISFLDTGATNASHTYTVQVKRISAGCTFLFQYCKLAAYGI